jgi:hypothetical protein
MDRPQKGASVKPNRLKAGLHALNFAKNNSAIAPANAFPQYPAPDFASCAASIHFT